MITCQCPDGSAVGAESLLAEQIHSLSKFDAGGKPLFALRLNEAKSGTIDRELDFVTRLKVIGALDRTAINQCGVRGGKMNQLPVVAVAHNSGMFAADSVERLIIAYLTGRITADFNLVDDDFL